MIKEKKYCVLSLSGGMDSATLLVHLLALDYDVTALSFDYGQKHKVELNRATQLVEYINDNKQQGPKVDQIYHNKIGHERFQTVKHHIIKIEGLTNLLDSTLVEGGEDVPEGHYEQENMKLTVVPNRNKMFSSILQAVALSIFQKVNSSVIIALGVHAGDHAIYPDCRKEFIDADLDAFRIGNWGGENISTYTPYLTKDKFDILKDGQLCCEKLGLDFNEIYSRTNTSYKPIKLTTQVDDPEMGLIFKEGWFSDYKSAASVERILAFHKLGIPDPVKYADNNVVVSWEVALNHTLKVEKDFRDQK